MRAAAETELAPDALARARLSTGRLLAARGEMLIGVRLLTQSGADDEARDLILGHATDMITGGRNQELVELIAMLSDNSRRVPLVRVWQATGRLPFEPSAAREVFRDVWRSANPAEQPVEFAVAVMGDINAALADWSIDAQLSSSIDEIDRALPLLAALPEAIHARLVMTRAVAMLLGCPTHRDVLNAQKHVEAVLPRLQAGRQLLLGGILVNYLLWWRGDLAAARPYLDSLAPLASRPDVPPLATMAWYFGALTIAFRDGNDGEVRRLMREVVAFAQKWGTQHRLANAYWVAAQAYAAAGDRPRLLPASRVPCSLAARTSLGRISCGRRSRSVKETRISRLARRQPRTNGQARSAIRNSADCWPCSSRWPLPSRETTEHASTSTSCATLPRDPTAPFFTYMPTWRRPAMPTAQDRVAAFVAAWNGMAHLACQLGFRRISGLDVAHFGYLANVALHRGAEVGVTRRLVALWTFRLHNGQMSTTNGLIGSTSPALASLRSGLTAINCQRVRARRSASRANSSFISLSPMAAISSRTGSPTNSGRTPMAISRYTASQRRSTACAS